MRIHLALIILGFIVTDTRLYGYEGIFYNSNSLGQVVCTLMVIVFSSRNGVNIFNSAIFRLVVLAALFLVLILTSSRLSLLVVVLVYLASFLLNRNISRTKTKGLVRSVLILLALGIFWTPLKNLVELSVMSKFERKQGDISSGRTELWKVGISNAGFTGLGRDYYMQAGLDNHSAHNTFVSITVQSGYLAGFSYFMFWLSMLYHFFRSRTDPLNRLGFLLTLCFILLSFGESMNGKLVMYLPLLMANKSLGYNLKREVRSSQII